MSHIRTIHPTSWFRFKRCLFSALKTAPYCPPRAEFLLEQQQDLCCTKRWKLYIVIKQVKEHSSSFWNELCMKSSWCFLPRFSFVTWCAISFTNVTQTQHFVSSAPTWAGVTLHPQELVRFVKTLVWMGQTSPELKYHNSFWAQSNHCPDWQVWKPLSHVRSWFIGNRKLNLWWRKEKHFHTGADGRRTQCNENVVDRICDIFRKSNQTCSLSQNLFGLGLFSWKGNNEVQELWYCSTENSKWNDFSDFSLKYVRIKRWVAECYTVLKQAGRLPCSLSSCRTTQCSWRSGGSLQLTFSEEVLR